MKISIKDYMSIMIHQTDLTLTRYIKAKLAPLNITPEQNLILLLLWGKDGRSQNEIAKSLVKDKTNITRMLDNLEKKELITRHINESDARSYNVYLTEKGIKLGEHVYPITEEFNRMVCSGITSEELQIANKVFLKIQKNIESSSQ